MLSTFLNDFYKLLLKKYITFIFLWGKELVFDRFLIEKLVSIEITIKLHSVTHRTCITPTLTFRIIEFLSARSGV